MQQYDYPVFIAETKKRGVKLFHALPPLGIPERIVGSWQAREAVTGQFAFLDGVHAPASEAPPLINEKIVHNPAQPGSGFFDLHEVVEFAVCLDKEFLKKILCLGLLPGQTPRETVQAVKMRSYEFFEPVCRAVYGLPPFWTKI